MRISTHLSESSSLKLGAAILLYGVRDEGESCAFATLNSVVHSPRGPVIMTGIPLGRETLLKTAQSLAAYGEGERERAVLPEQVLYLDGAVMAWYAPPAVRPIYFDTENATFNSNVNGHRVPHPGLVFIARQNHNTSDLFVWAYADEGRPTMETKLYRAPYFNLYRNGHMCEGTFVLPGVLNVDTISTFATAFWDTNFAHTNVDQTELCAHPHGHHAMWTELARREEVRESLRARCKRKRSQTSTFPTNYLRPDVRPGGEQLTLKEALRGS